MTRAFTSLNVCDDLVLCKGFFHLDSIQLDCRNPFVLGSPSKTSLYINSKLVMASFCPDILFLYLEEFIIEANYLFRRMFSGTIFSGGAYSLEPDSLRGGYSPGQIISGHIFSGLMFSGADVLGHIFPPPS